MVGIKVGAKNMDTELKKIVEEAEKGNLESQFYLSELYRPNCSVIRYGDPVFKWLRESSENGNIESQYKLATLWHFGCNDIPVNYMNAIRLYLMAAENGHEKAAFNLAIFYEEGKFVTKNISKTNELFKKCAIQGDEKALNIFDLKTNTTKKCDFFGLNADPHRPSTYEYTLYNIKQSQEEHLKWCRMAAERGHVPAQLVLAEYFGEGPPVFPDKQGVKDYYKESLKWYRKAAEQGESSAQLDISEHTSRLIKAAEQGNAYAQLQLALQYRREAMCPQDIIISLKWYRAAQSKSLGNEYGWLFNVNEGVPENYQDAKNWYRRKALNGDLEALNNLLKIYPDDNDEDLITLAATQGCLDAQVRLSDGYYNEEEWWLCLEECDEKCFQWTLKAAEQGDMGSQARLAELYEGKENVTGLSSDAFIWRLKAATQGDATSQFIVGLAYKEAYNRDAARVWFLKAAEGGCRPAFGELGSLYYGSVLGYCCYLLDLSARSRESAFNLENSLTISQIHKGNEMALEWCSGHYNGCNWLLKELRKAEAKLEASSE